MASTQYTHQMKHSYNRRILASSKMFYHQIPFYNCRIHENSNAYSISIIPAFNFNFSWYFEYLQRWYLGKKIPLDVCLKT